MSAVSADQDGPLEHIGCGHIVLSQVHGLVGDDVHGGIDPVADRIGAALADPAVPVEEEHRTGRDTHDVTIPLGV